MGRTGTDFWYCVFCKPRQEAVAEANLQRQGFPVYLPRIRARHRRGGQWVSAIEALFPRYLFIRIDPLRRSTATVRSTRGVVGLVRFGPVPAAVPDTVIEALLQNENPASGLQKENYSPICVGTPVQLVDGPLAGVEGILAEEEGDKRVTVLLEFLGKTNKISVSRDWISSVA